ncbi:hypothetical protein P3521_08710 [Vibrio parahaemolyticus]|nr:hypothetical protein [Vibrio parahaemolyticus]MDF4669681.1 hypothetical protein [Vibrio parahaemolyticus]HAV1414942.1 hypothetical protein [Vibrio parahaemolyticus]HAV2004543.1 hypothetical protein [Vibrio parahaemolyticus]
MSKFSAVKLKHQIEDTISTIGRASKNRSVNEFQKERNEAIYRLLNDIGEYGNIWDDILSSVTTADDLEQILSNKRAIDDGYDDYLNRLCVLLYKYSCHFTLRYDGDVSTDTALGFMSVCQANLSRFDEVSQRNITQTHFNIPFKLVKDVINGEEIKKVRALENLNDELSIKQKEWEETLSNNISQANSLKESIEKYTAAFNFVGLSKGFRSLSKLKRKELRQLYKTQKSLSGAVIAIILLESFVSFSFLVRGLPPENILYTLLPFLSLVVVLLYFYRVNLSNLRNVEAQLLQIDLRNTLCKFIQSYSDYARNMSKGNQSGQSLEKFESLIFSGISMNPSDIPTTFDGLEKIAGILKSKT